MHLQPRVKDYRISAAKSWNYKLKGPQYSFVLRSEQQGILWRQDNKTFSQNSHEPEPRGKTMQPNRYV